MGSAPTPLEVTVMNVLGYQREGPSGWSVLLEVKIGGTVHEVCRLVFPTATAVADLQKFIAEASARPAG